MHYAATPLSCNKSATVTRTSQETCVDTSVVQLDLLLSRKAFRLWEVPNQKQQRIEILRLSSRPKRRCFMQVSVWHNLYSVMSSVWEIVNLFWGDAAPPPSFLQTPDELRFRIWLYIHHILTSVLIAGVPVSNIWIPFQRSLPSVVISLKCEVLVVL